MSIDVLSAFEKTAFPLELNDSSLVASAKRGDREAFDLLMERHERRILFTAMRITRNREDAEDVVQQSFQNAFIHLDEFEEKASFSTWLTRIALNEALMHKRRTRRAQVSLDEPHSAQDPRPAVEMVDSRPGPDSSFFQDERSRLLLSAMNGLKPEMRSAIEACDLAEKSVKETADLLGVSLSAAKSRISRGRAALREKLKRHFLPVSLALPAKGQTRGTRRVPLVGAVAN